uniref:Large ribosomal subunit protein bL35c n=1 Tax=Spyridia filamentosa TaxID=196632 RepID=A0A1Z1MJI2_SPYFI|nr:ribosomal protein L35 [Spyridia filamentosa]ARW66227.1 ribosomal protein L35 [Spyridia filamentosa]
MSKLKIKKSIIKRFRLTASNSLMRRKASRSHLLQKKSSKRKLRLRRTALVNNRDIQNFRHGLSCIC